MTKDLQQEAEDARHKINNFFDKNATTGSMSSNNKGGVTGAVTTVTGTVSGPTLFAYNISPYAQSHAQPKLSVW